MLMHGKTNISQIYCIKNPCSLLTLPHRGGGGGAQGPFCVEKCIFVQTNVAVNTNLSSKVPFVFPKHSDTS